MPEGHTIHRLARDHRRWFAGQTLKCGSPQGRFTVEAKSLNGRTLEDVSAHGKHLFYHFSGDRNVHIHLGLYGKFRVIKLPAPEPRGQVRWRVLGTSKGFDLNGPNRCELLSGEDVQRLRTRLGQDPLRADSDPEQLWARWRRCRSPVGSALLNQGLISGVGNIYRSEVLFLLRIHPHRPAASFTRSEFDVLWEQTKSLLELGVRYNKIITVPLDAHDKPPSRWRAGERLNCYKHQDCPECGYPIETELLAARTLYYCPTCQRE